MRFKARTLSTENVISITVLEAVDEIDARAHLLRQSLKVLSLEPMREALPSLRKSRQRFSLLLFSQELHALLTAGLSLIEALEGLEEKEEQRETRQIIGNLLAALREGKRFSAALQLQRSIFPPLYVGLLQAAEGTGNLAPTLQRYIHYQQRIDSVRRVVINSLLYPAILLVAGGAVTLFLVGFVVPKFAVVYQGSGRNLPLLSQWLLGWGLFASQHWRELLLGAGITTILAVLRGRSYFRHGGLLKLAQWLPSLNQRYKPYLLSRLYLTLGTLLEGGMPIVAALKTVRSVIPEDWQRKLDAVQASIESGHSLSAALAAQDLTTPITIRMIRVGEQTGQLGSMLCRAAEFYEGDISRFIERFMKTFEPALMAAIGLVTGVIVLLLYMPIFDLAGNLE